MDNQIQNDAPRSDDLPIDRVFKRPPWKSRAFWIWTVGCTLLTIANLTIYQLQGHSFGEGDEAAQLVGRFIGQSLIDFTIVVAPAYILFLVFERLLPRASLSPDQNRIVTRLAAAVGVVICAVLVAYFRNR